ncbi:MAG TPA: tetratricopeptide repeat protein [Chthonomonadaceae bacterium]|nr:tetratricopeptide repeat protein [Chthonomonadaceae bacterium]
MASCPGASAVSFSAIQKSADDPDHRRPGACFMPMPEPSSLSLPISERGRSRRSATSPSWQRLLRRAERQAERGAFSEAIASLTQAIAAGANDCACYLQLADLYRVQRQWEAALAAAEQALALDPSRLAAYETMMTIALEAGDCRRAIAAGRALLKISPRHVPAHDTLGAAYIQMGDVDAAMRITNALIRLDPDTAAHHFKKALLCQHKGEIALAVQEFTEALLLDPNGPHAEDAREALQALDAHQLNQIVTLAMEDSVFRLKLDREPVEAAAERGFYLSETGNQLLIELSSFVLSESPHPCRPIRYN